MEPRSSYAGRTGTPFGMERERRAMPTSTRGPSSMPRRRQARRRGVRWLSRSPRAIRPPARAHGAPRRPRPARRRRGVHPLRHCVIVVNAGAGRIGASMPISMTADDVIRTARAAPEATVVAVHLEALSHCPMRREELRSDLRSAELDGRVLVPNDGETLDLA